MHNRLCNAVFLHVHRDVSVPRLVGVFIRTMALCNDTLYLENRLKSSWLLWFGLDDGVHRVKVILDRRGEGCAI